jgi:hypothetical protein
VAEDRRGGNSILERIEDRCEGPDLHADWDAIPGSFGTSANGAFVAAAKAVPRTPSPVENFAAAWASYTVKASHSAFAGLTFTGTCGGHWLVHFKNHDQYASEEETLKHDQIAKAGAHLAELLNAIWQ